GWRVVFGGRLGRGPGDMDAVGFEEGGEGSRRHAGRVGGPGAQVVGVVAVLGFARGGEPTLVHLEGGDRGDVAGADVGGRPAGGEAGAGVEVVVVAEADGALTLGLERLGGCGGQGGRGGRAGGRAGVLAGRERAHRQGGIAAADQDDAVVRGAAHHLGRERGVRAERGERGGGGDQLGGRGGRSELIRVLRPEHRAGGGVGDRR